MYRNYFLKVFCYHATIILEIEMLQNYYCDKSLVICTRKSKSKFKLNYIA